MFVGDIVNGAAVDCSRLLQLCNKALILNDHSRYHFTNTWRYLVQKMKWKCWGHSRGISLKMQTEFENSVFVRVENLQIFETSQLRPKWYAFIFWKISAKSYCITPNSCPSQFSNACTLLEIHRKHFSNLPIYCWNCKVFLHQTDTIAIWILSWHLICKMLLL